MVDLFDLPNDLPEDGTGRLPMVVNKGRAVYLGHVERRILSILDIDSMGYYEIARASHLSGRLVAAYLRQLRRRRIVAFDDEQRCWTLASWLQRPNAGG